MSLIQLFNTLNKEVQNLIKLFYLGFGSPSAVIFRGFFVTDLRTQRSSKCKENCITAWKYKMLTRPKENLYDIRSGIIAASELKIAFFSDEPDSEYKNEILHYNHNLISFFQKMKLNKLTKPEIHGTPTALIMRKYITMLSSRFEDNPLCNTIWRIRVHMTRGILTDKKIINLKPVCNTQVYNELTAAYNAK